ncbi:putative RNA pseudouridine synthase YlyB [Paenibacillus larvae subsp. larvae]|uniref:Pseudouridine synthase n=1 Tax=Paenibacillus larvae subsp. larvae TaxID=147375 RepID=A0A2L1UG26_9BACL|nr:RluA family pseudouridine synthase [Paenibacillus larvae]AQT83845.1 RNA pseudouridine synthase [Paenibacillus larvae subsp. pulvifaciens]AQZ45283.1 RNA pseudouridine synthase [Paenibacillus larvae subsp. pulvifaciens]AVF27227.1 putative RNA pseudouridine synthase YlyB [Paenibacillus larvae subsp. larvae]AVF31890.1 putative RNA pseudouridine synthase YlyB [Paenibacillus larvae subsp. larvae]MCY7521206.1 RluA family pseudouridine synthase [Paenibacillus larvae]
MKNEHIELDGFEDWIAGEEHAGERIDKFVSESLDGVSRTQIQQWIKEGHISVNEKQVKPNYKLAEGDRIKLNIPDPEQVDIRPEPIPLDIYYEDKDVIVVNKPRGMVVHPAPGHSSGTLVNALMYHCKDLSGINGEMRPGIVHRIDKDTSGLIMAAKHDKAHASLADQLREHSVTRKYLALVQGNLAHEQGTVEAPIGRDPKDRKLYTVTEKNSKEAVTHFVVMERFGDYTLTELKLETGRTHQIRVHMKFIGHPLVGDPAYGKSKKEWIRGQALHAAVLGFKHPMTREYLEFEAPLPEDMKQLIHSLRNR